MNGDVIRDAQGRAAACVRLRTHSAGTAPDLASLRGPSGPGSEILSLSLSVDFLGTSGLPVDASSPLGLSLRVDFDWLAEPVPARPSDVHEVVVRPVTTAATDASVWGESAEVTVEQSVPGPDDLRRMGISLTDAEELDLAEFAFDPLLNEVVHQVFGYAARIQGDVWRSMEYDLQRQPDAEAYERFRVMPHRLLFQVDSEDFDRRNIADGGRLYVLIPEADLQAGRFDRTLPVVESS